ncbi:MAG: plasmid pRiA4b ORF-3 family protein [Salinivirgaceae bacterium]|nr:plasmid pRiA4b ORF-3 family protein [Salinivirgaceae bacterium]
MTFQFKIQIKGITQPPVWRKISMPAKCNFYDLHLAIQVAFGWENYHLFQFSPRGYGSKPVILIPHEDDCDFGESLSVEDIKLSYIFKTEKQKFTYIYDFGDDWVHTIVLEKILPELSLYPKLLAGKGHCPPEDCGGVWGYESLKKTLLDKANPENKELAEWLGLEDDQTWNAAEFDLEATQKLMMEVFAQE